jgi:N-acetylglutamate synthase-like GNAT family acetyltransferase
VIVRDFRESDRTACTELFAELVDVHRALYPDGDVGGEFGVEGRLFVAEEAGRVVGYAGLIPHRRRAELEPIVVAHGHRGRGIGKALVERAIAAARDGGATGVFVRPTARNRDAIGFFHNAGFDRLSYLRLEVDFEPRERRAGERIGERDFAI